MYVGKIKPLSLRQRLWCFIRSYSGIALVLGVICLIWAILYKLVFLCIVAPWLWMQTLGEVFFSIALSVVASVIFYYITTFFPNMGRKAIIDRLILKWLQQLNWYGEMIIGDIVNTSYNDVSKISEDELLQVCNKKLSSKPVLGGFYMLGPNYRNWFEYFQDKFKHEDEYIQKCRQYSESLPVQILDLFEELEIHDQLRNAINGYQYQLATRQIESIMGEKVVDYNNMSNLADLIWKHCKNLRSLIDTYQKNSYM